MKHGVILSAIALAEDASTDVYEKILDKKKRKYIPLMVDRAVKVGSVKLLEAMTAHKTCKKYTGKIKQAQEAARAIGEYRNMFMDKQDKSKEPIGPLVPVFGTGSGAEEGYRSGYAVVKISSEGEISMLYQGNPFGGSNNFQPLLSGYTVPAYMGWKPVESYALVLAK